MFAHNILKIASVGGLVLGTLTGLAWHPAMNRLPLRPWQAPGQPHPFEYAAADITGDSTPVPGYATAGFTPASYMPATAAVAPVSPAVAPEPLPRLELAAAEAPPAHPFLRPTRVRDAAAQAVAAPDDDTDIADTPEDAAPEEDDIPDFAGD